MQNKSKFDELLISYLSNELNKEDEVFVLEWINFDEQNRLYFKELSDVWRLLNVKQAADKIDVNDEWKYFKRAVNNKQQETYLLKEVESIAGEISYDEKRKTKPTFYRIVTTAIAASVLLVIGLTSVVFKNNKPAKQSFATAVDKRNDTLVTFVKYEKNTSGKLKRILLKDGSEVMLSDKSEVYYREPFSGKRRDITLIGRAYFKVAKDKTKPFTVFSGDISTTVLGTRFTVTAFKNSKNIIVRLYEGKVVVKPVSTIKKNIKDYYLKPGQELTYNNLSSAVSLQLFNVGNTNTVKINNSNKINEQPDVPSVPSNETGSWYMFNNQSLEQVFKQLENMYNVQILYSKREVYNRYFIGKFQKSDSVELVLKQIAALNNLKVTNKNSKFIISK